MDSTTQGAASLSPLDQRAIEIDVADAFLSALEDRIGVDAAAVVFQQAVDAMADRAARHVRRSAVAPGLAGLWDVWGVLGGDGRLDLHLDELTEHTLRFHVDRCAYAEMYRSRGLERVGVAFSCRRDAPFAEALVPGVRVEQTMTILEGSPRCEFTYTLEDR